MVSRKRGRQEMEEDVVQSSRKPSTLDQLRSMWQFANLMQYIYIFGKAVKIDEDLDIEDLEEECLKPGRSDKLEEIGLALLKCVSSHRGLTHDLFDEYTRRQYQSRAPDRNPFGDEELPLKFAEFDIFTKIRVLQQLSQWSMIHSERIRERMPEQKDSDQIQWRVEEIGYDSEDRSYFVLDDNRLYRRSEPPPPPPPAWKPKANTKKAKAAARAAKRRRISTIPDDDEQENKDETSNEQGTADDGFGEFKWECLAVTLQQYTDFLDSIRRSKDPNEKYLHKTLTEDVLPVIEKLEEEQQRKAAKREKDLLNLQKLATAKRSSRIADKLEKQKVAEEEAEAQRARQAELSMALKEQQRQKQMEEARQSRMMTREQRLKDREMRRILHEQELAKLSESTKSLTDGEGRVSERHLKAEMERRQKELEKIAQEEDWFFDCSVCGVHGENIDDGSHSVACEKCNVWQHSACLGISQEEAEREDFHFVCQDCKRRIEDAKKPKLPSLKFKLGPSSSPPQISLQKPDQPASVNNQGLQISPSKPLKAESNGDFKTTSQSVSPLSGPGLMHSIPGPQNDVKANGLPHNSPANPTVNNFCAAPPPIIPHAPQQWTPSQGIADMRYTNPTVPHVAQQVGQQHNGSSVHQQQQVQMQSMNPVASYPNGVYSTPLQDGRRPMLDPLSQVLRPQNATSPPQPSPVKNPTPSSSQENRGSLARFPSPQGGHSDVLPPLAPHSPGKLSSPPQLHPSSSPSNSGLSPTKHSSPPRPMSSHSVSHAPIFPPMASLSPSPNPANVPSPSKSNFGASEPSRMNGH